MPTSPPSRPARPRRAGRTPSVDRDGDAADIELLRAAQRRLRPLRLVGPPLDRVEAVVEWLGAVQAQDYLGAKWAVAQRTKDASDDDFEQAFARGAILRTHVLRPTWHFVAPADIRWLLQLTAPRVQAVAASYYRNVGLDARMLARGDDVLAKALQGGKQLIRAELVDVLRAASLPADGMRPTFLMMHAELEAAICSGARRGKQHTYAALDERAAAARARPRDEALAELARRYFASHGPAHARDLAWWSGLKVSDAVAAIATLGAELQEVRVAEQTFWTSARSGAAPRRAASDAAAATVRLLPNFDEYLIACRDHASALDPRMSRSLGARESILANHVVSGSGHIVGDWQRTLQRGQVTVQVQLSTPLADDAHAALVAEADRYGRFLGLPARLQVTVARRAKAPKQRVTRAQVPGT